MTYANYETSIHDGAPTELFKFSFGRGSFYFTSGDAVLVKDGARYQPEAISRTEIGQDAEDGSGTINVTLPASNPVAQLFQAYLPSSQVTVEIWRRHRVDADAELVLVYAGTVTAAEFDDSACSLTCQPVGSRLGRSFPATLFQPQCRNSLFSQSGSYGEDQWHTDSGETVGCNASKAAYRVDATVTAISDISLTAAAFGAKPDGWFTGGVIEFDNGEVRYVSKHIGSVVELSYRIDVAVGAVVAAFPGCDGLETTCKSKFNNVINFTGFSRVPTRNPYTSSIT